MLTYEPYKKNKLAIRGPNKYDQQIKNIGGRINNRLPDGPGWTISVDKEHQLLHIFFENKIVRSYPSQ